MKTLALALLITITSFSFAQNNSNKENNITFNVEIEDGVCVLNWESNREVNTSYYLIEKSIDGKNFETLSTQKAGSSTYQWTSYSFEDLNANNANSQYRITLVKMDGSTVSTLSNLSLEENVAEAIVK